MEYFESPKLSIRGRFQLLGVEGDLSIDEEISVSSQYD